MNQPTVTIDNTDLVIKTVNIAMLKRLETAGDILKKSMQNECPVGETGNLRKSIKRTLEPENLAVRVSAGNKKAWYAHLVLFGTVARWTWERGARYGRGRRRIKKKKYTGVMPPNNFMLRALDKAMPFLRNLFGKEIQTDEMAERKVA